MEFLLLNQFLMGVGARRYLALIHGASLRLHSIQPFPGLFGSHCLQGAIYVLHYHAAFSDDLIAPPALLLVGCTDELAIGADSGWEAAPTLIKGTTHNQ